MEIFSKAVVGCLAIISDSGFLGNQIRILCEAGICFDELMCATDRVAHFIVVRIIVDRVFTCACVVQVATHVL